MFCCIICALYNGVSYASLLCIIRSFTHHSPLTHLRLHTEHKHDEALIDTQYHKARYLTLSLLSLASHASMHVISPVPPSHSTHQPFHSTSLPRYPRTHMHAPPAQRLIPIPRRPAPQAHSHHRIPMTYLKLTRTSRCIYRRDT